MFRRAFLASLLLCLAGHSSAATILLTNDDGYQAPGISALYAALTEANHEVILVAPAQQQSGSSASITSSGVALNQHKENIYSVTGKPADAVLIGLSEVFKDKKPDLIISGANFGQNSGRDAMISGTVGAATVGHGRGVPTIAISVELNFAEIEQRFPATVAAMPGAAAFVVRLLDSGVKLPDEAILNINYPARQEADIKGVKATKLADYSLFSGSYRKTEEGLLRPNFNVSPAKEKGTDAYELSQGFITLTRLDGSYGLPVNRELKRIVKTLNK